MTNPNSTQRPPLSSETLQPFNLLPSEYRTELRIRRIAFAWITVAVTLLCILLVILCSQFHRRQLANAFEQRTIERATPLLKMRNAITLLETRNQRAMALGKRARSAKPDESLLQVLAAIAVASHSPEDALLIQELLIRLPVETEAVDPAAASFQPGQIQISAVCATPAAANRWAEQLTKHPRLEQVGLTTTATGGSKTIAVVNAKPLATRVVP